MKLEDRIYPITYKGKEIYYTDWTNLKDGETFEEAIRYTAGVVIQMNKYELLELLNVSGSFFTKAVFRTMQETARPTKKFNKKKAIVGDFSSTRLFMLKTVNRITGENVVPFKTEQEALDWLVEDN